MSVFAQRLKEARLRAGLSQERLGLDAGLDPMSASTRMNRYELGKRMPDPELVERFGSVLGVPGCYFYAADDTTAKLLLAFSQLSDADRVKVIDLVEQLAG
jgi:transcriptional regulator with XRE-family HTH domain